MNAIFPVAGKETLLQQAEKPRAGNHVILDRPTLIAAPRDIVRAMFRQIWQRENWPQLNMDHTAWDRTAAIVHGESHTHHFPGHIGIHAIGTVRKLESSSMSQATHKGFS